MKKLFASALCIALAVTMSPINLIAAGRVVAQNAGEIAGTAKSDKGIIMGNARVRLMDSDKNLNVGEMRTNPQGEFKFTGLPVGSYFVEILDDDGKVIGRTVKVTLAAGAMVATGLALSGSAAGIGAAAGVAAAGGSFFATTAGIVTVVAVGAGVTAAVVAVTNDASASGG